MFWASAIATGWALSPKVPVVPTMDERLAELDAIGDEIDVWRDQFFRTDQTEESMNAAMDGWEEAWARFDKLDREISGRKPAYDVKAA